MTDGTVKTPPHPSTQVQTPTVCRIVQFKDNAGHIMPAIITRVWSDTLVNLTAFPDPSDASLQNAVERPTSVEYDDSLEQPYRWRWPPRA